MADNHLRLNSAYQTHRIPLEKPNQQLPIPFHCVGRVIVTAEEKSSPVALEPKWRRTMLCARSTACEISQVEGRRSVPGDGRRYRIRRKVQAVSEILTATFVLAVHDLDVSKRFYMEKLGFAEDMSVDGWSFLSRGACKLRLGDCPGIKPMSDAPDHSWFAYLHVRDARGLYAEIVKNEVEIWHEIADKPWGMREFAIASPDGHRIVFGETLPA